MYSNVNLKTIFEELLIILITIWKLIVVFVGKFLQILRVMQEKEGLLFFTKSSAAFSSYAGVYYEKNVSFLTI